MTTGGRFGLIVEELRRRLINELPPGNLYREVAETGGLPVYCDLGGCLIFAADGTVWSYDLATGEREPEHDREQIRVAHILASEKYEELRDLKPSRPLSAKQCSLCQGTGRLTAEKLRCGECLGLGWVEPQASG